MDFEQQFNNINKNKDGKKKVDGKNFPWSKALRDSLIATGLFIATALPMKAENEKPLNYDDGIKRETADLYKRFEEAGVFKGTYEEFLELSEEEIKKVIVPAYMKAIGAILPAEANPNAKVIKITKFQVTEENEENQNYETSENIFDFEEWFQLQVKAGNVGKTIKAPDGKFYKIEINKNKTVSKSNKYKKILIDKNTDNKDNKKAQYYKNTGNTAQTSFAEDYYNNRNRG